MDRFGRSYSRVSVTGVVAWLTGTLGTRSMAAVRVGQKSADVVLLLASCLSTSRGTLRTLRLTDTTQYSSNSKHCHNAEHMTKNSRNPFSDYSLDWTPTNLSLVDLALICY